MSVSRPTMRTRNTVLTPSPHPLSALVGPLRYACQRNFAQLSTVKDLRALIERALSQARTQGADERQLEMMAGELHDVDHPSPEVRKAALRRVLASIVAVGIELPGELVALAGGAGHPARPERSDASREVEGPRHADRPEPLGYARDRRSDAGRVVEEPRRRRNRSGTPPTSPVRSDRSAPQAIAGNDGADSEDDVKPSVLSIAPASGPLSTPIGKLGWRTNPRLLATLARKGMNRAGDVLFLLPRCYEDRRRMRKIAQLRPGERGVIVGTVKSAGDIPVRTGRRQFRAVIGDETGSVAATFFQTGPWLKARFPIGKRVVISGELRASHAGREIPHPEVEPAEDLATSSVHFNRIVPIYPGFERHEQRAFRALAYRISERFASSIEEPLPAELRSKLGLASLSEALHGIHFPGDEDLPSLNAHASRAHRRLAFDELFFLQLGLLLRRQGIKTEQGIPFNVGPERVARAQAALPFQLTRAQSRVVKEICGDMGSAEPMNRLIQGDVGSGKTAVAVIATAIALQDGFQVAFMAPTEILAEQHAQTLGRILEPMGFKVGLVTAAGSSRQKREVRQALGSGEVKVAVGTHALIQESVQFQRLGLAVIDEQHRFGVIQRHALMSKGLRPDVLVMTATPIPRTLAMTLYGDLEVSVIDELPPGRTPVLTRVFIEKQRPRVYEAMTHELQRGRQCYVVHPLVEESEKVDLADATQGADRLKELFPIYRVGLLHGRLRPEEKDAVMADFRAQRIQILVCTTVVEVGLDVPNASVMVIEAAERFGLSQLHQLRGRVGRGAAASHCFLVAGYARSKEAADRLSVMEMSNDGFVIAEKDLELRGPGEFLGTRQSGLPELAVANLARDGALLSVAREEARRIIECDPVLSRPEHRGLAKALQERWEGRLALASVG